jgi:hypothetical protein
VLHLRKVSRRCRVFVRGERPVHQYPRAAWRW